MPGKRLNNQNKKRQNRQKRQSSVKVAKIECDVCSKPFSSTSSLNSHKKSKHEGRGWMCPVCQRTLASKYAYIRHTKRAHRSKRIDVVEANAQVQEVYVRDDVAEMSEAAKNVLIVNLRKKVAKRDKTIALLRYNLEKYIKNSKKKTEKGTGKLNFHQVLK